MLFLFFFEQKNKIKSKVMKIVQMIILMLIMLCNISPGIKSENPDPLSPALYVFGDSLLDNGNNNLLPTVSKANYPPYGMNFEKGPTGRFTNGRNVADFIAEYLGLPYSAPYVSLSRVLLLQSDQLRGLNFASASCGILHETGKEYGLCLSLAEQIDSFERTVNKKLQRHFESSDDLSNYLSKSVFIISTGNNDYINNYLNTDLHDTSKRYTPQSFANLLNDNLSQQLQRLYRLGARKVIMFEIGPIGCMPWSIRKFEHSGRCVEEHNQLAVMFNERLASMLHDLTSTLAGSTFVLGHVHGLGYDAVINPSKYGLSDSSNPCCVAWFNGTSACIPGLKALACKHPNKHYFFDAYHLTETLYKTIATLCFNGSSICLPKNIKDLVS